MSGAAASPTLLVVDDDPSVRHVFDRVFRERDFRLLTAKSAADALHLVGSEDVDVVILDLVLPDGSGLELFQKFRAADPRIGVIFITAGGASDTAIEAMKLGALDYLLKPLDYGKVRALVGRAFEIRRLMSEPVAVAPPAGSTTSSGDALIGRCAAMQDVYKAIGRVASQNVTVLIRGESGTGKELVARALYQHGNRADAAFMVVNCAAIPETLLESELFGHEKGSFTGADRRRIGRFEQCSGGTLFLDEIGDMSPILQSKMLRVLQEQTFERVGGNDTIATDVRVLAATNRDLEAMVANNEFRSDLYYRLNGYTIALPPLRQRNEDLDLLVSHFLARANHELGKEVQRVAQDAREILEKYSWPGNVRELQSVIRQAVLQAEGPVLLRDFLPVSLQEPGWSMTSMRGAIVAENEWDRFVDDRLREGTTTLYDESLDRMERHLLSRVLRHTSGNQVEAAQLLGITRTTLRTKLQKLGITVGRVIQEGDAQPSPEAEPDER
ncbi:MAG: sigma-54-dependent Fis family transcriptional regulator [Planctomycetota bacterium]|mgnify:CR=1 FL=1|nr:MAG: sigma-54-dependent Fis family transcriptional regulator [Planctomycetota bacterium]REJ90904.1 MAG: sigma-54-dependent Fis family transcriptional regulator [Planctomycetota bacterium]REK17681.1 MAG: sigma-54-dependent Fis family transcriptional regulator [Planctomycetota bacterium]REK46734.1 MAG: sigma-54-dependent Fis family transcriptional regulator [Planctomycetota bacterium]